MACILRLTSLADASGYDETDYVSPVSTPSLQYSGLPNVSM